MIQNVQGSTSVAKNYGTPEKQEVEKQEVLKEQEAATFKAGNVEEKKEVTYNRPQSKKVDQGEVGRLLAEAEKSYQGLKDLILRLIDRQGHKVEDILSGREKLFIDDEARAEASAAIAEDGEWGVQAVSDRLVNFAIAVAGHDKAKFAEIKGAIDKGFKEAEKAFGGSLPEISQKTYDETMRKLDNWANGQE